MVVESRLVGSNGRGQIVDGLAKGAVRCCAGSGFISDVRLCALHVAHQLRYGGLLRFIGVSDLCDALIVRRQVDAVRGDQLIVCFGLCLNLIDLKLNRRDCDRRAFTDFSDCYLPRGSLCGVCVGKGSEAAIVTRQRP
ncbi:hypothetical protein D3C80_1351670 [compost metagenome]